MPATFGKTLGRRNSSPSFFIFHVLKWVLGKRALDFGLYSPTFPDLPPIIKGAAEVH